MNGFHVHAIGWVLTANMFTLTSAEAHDLAEAWADLVRIRAEDLRRAHPLLRWLLPRSLPLAPATHAALAALVARMTAQHPDRFGTVALRKRRNHWACQVALGVLLSAVTTRLVPTSWPWAAPLAPTFFLVGCVCLLPTVTLWRAAKAVRECSTQDRVAVPLVQRWSHRFRTH